MRKLFHIAHGLVWWRREEREEDYPSDYPMITVDALSELSGECHPSSKQSLGLIRKGKFRRKFYWRIFTADVLHGLLSGWTHPTEELEFLQDSRIIKMMGARLGRRSFLRATGCSCQTWTFLFAMSSSRTNRVRRLEDMECRKNEPPLDYLLKFDLAITSHRYSWREDMGISASLLF